MSTFTQPRERRVGRKSWGGVLLVILAVGSGLAFWRLRPQQEESALAAASVEELRAVIAARPTDARAYFYLGKGLGRKRQNAPALDALSKAASLDRDDEEIWIEAAGTTNGVKGPAAAFQVMDDFLKRHPKSPNMQAERTSLLTALQLAADGFADKKRYPEAMRYYKIWLDEEPNSARAQQGLARSQQAQSSRNVPK
jgi:tetratricopeptide (TPR) repeat protein